MTVSEMARMGGHAVAAKRTPAERRALAMNAVKARWRKYHAAKESTTMNKPNIQLRAVVREDEPAPPPAAAQDFVRRAMTADREQLEALFAEALEHAAALAQSLQAAARARDKALEERDALAQERDALRTKLDALQSSIDFARWALVKFGDETMTVETLATKADQERIRCGNEITSLAAERDKLRDLLASAHHEQFVNGYITQATWRDIDAALAPTQTQTQTQTCTYPDCGCDGARNCMARNPNEAALSLNRERATPPTRKEEA